jgi:S1-C subfamily serine protease
MTSTTTKANRRKRVKKTTREPVAIPRSGSAATAGTTAPPKQSTAKRLIAKRSAQKIGGVAPFVRPPSRMVQWRKAKTWGRRGFVPLSPGREKRRHRILPRTVIGISSMFLAFGVGAAFAGAAFYAYYDNRLAEDEHEIARFVDGFDEQFTDASGALDELRVDAIEQIRAELAPLGDYATDANGVLGLPLTVGPSVWLVETRNQTGQPSVGSAFAITGHQGGTALVTSLGVVDAATASPGPDIVLVKGDQRLAARLWAWDPVHDLALLVVSESVPLLEVASPPVQSNALGGRVFAISGLGGQGATASPGVLVDRSPSGLQHTAVIGAFFEGGPLLDGDGRVVGVATSTYRPFGVDPGLVAQAPDVTALCSRILRCADMANPIPLAPAAAGG